MMQTMQGRSAALVAALVGVIALGGCSGPDEEDALLLYAGAGLRKAVNPAIKAFEKKYGIKVVVDYAGSGTILTTAKEKKIGDLFMPGDVWYVDELDKQAGLIAEKKPVAYFVPVILVRKDNPKGIKTLGDLFGADVRVGLGNAQACQIGRLSMKLLARNGLDRKDLTRGAVVPMESLTVNELGMWVENDKVDAAIVWDAIARNYAHSCDMVEIPTDKNIISHVVIGLMTTSKRPADARKFIAFLTSGAGQAILGKNNLRTDAP